MNQLEYLRLVGRDGSELSSSQTVAQGGMNLLVVIEWESSATGRERPEVFRGLWGVYTYLFVGHE